MFRAVLLQPMKEALRSGAKGIWDILGDFTGLCDELGTSSEGDEKLLKDRYILSLVSSGSAAENGTIVLAVGS